MRFNESIRDLLLLSSFFCALTSGVIVVALTFWSPFVVESRVIQHLPPDWQEMIVAFRFVLVISAVVVLVLSVIAFVGLFFRSSSVLGFGLWVLGVLIVAEVATAVYLYRNDPTGENASKRIWMNMTEEQKTRFMARIQCDSEPTCRARVQTIVLSEANLSFVLGLGLGLAFLQMLTFCFGYRARRYLKRGRTAETPAPAPTPVRLHYSYPPMPPMPPTTPLPPFV